MPKIEDHIQRAMQEGKFEDLPGKGKPLRLDGNPLEDPEWRLAFHMLRGGGFTLPWIETRQEIEAGIEAARATLKQAWEWREEALAGDLPTSAREDEWKRALEAFREQVERLNQCIADYNLQAPNEHFQRSKLNLKREIEAVTSGQAKGV